MSGRNPAGGHSEELLAQYDGLIAAEPGVERRGATLPYTSVNGHMFSFVSESGSLALRLSPADRQDFIERYGAGLHEAHGTLMKEYVTVPSDLFRDPERLAPWFRSSYGYVSALKPKRTTRKAK